MIKHLERLLEERRKGFINIRSSIGRTVRIGFGIRLSTRNYSGDLKFDHKNGLLELTVCPEGGNALKKRDIKTLSGGEKSYATISLILALWDSIQPPFRLLDEFDVYMDMLNRRVALQQVSRKRLSMPYSIGYKIISVVCR